MDTLFTIQTKELEDTVKNHPAEGRLLWLIDQLKNKYTEISNLLDTRSTELKKLELAHSSDIATINEALNKAAEDRDFCSEYEEWIEDLSGELSHYSSLTGRSFEYEVTVEVTRVFKEIVTVTVNASSEEDAEELVRDEAGSFVDDACQQEHNIDEAYDVDYQIQSVEKA